jgi:hypothetical protein
MKKKKKKQRACPQQKTSNGSAGSFLLVLVAKQTTIWPSRMNALLYGRKVYLDANLGMDRGAFFACGVWRWTGMGESRMLVAEKKNHAGVGHGKLREAGLFYVHHLERQDEK